jgi:hypothetical protein
MSDQFHKHAREPPRLSWQGRNFVPPSRSGLLPSTAEPLGLARAARNQHGVERPRCARHEHLVRHALLDLEIRPFRSVLLHKISVGKRAS